MKVAALGENFLSLLPLSKEGKVRLYNISKRLYQLAKYGRPIRRWKWLVRHPAYLGHAIRPDTFIWAKLYYHLNVWLHPAEVRKRRSYEFPKGNKKSFRIDPAAGYNMVDLTLEPKAIDAIEFAKKITLQVDRANAHSKEFLIETRLSLEDPANEPIAALCCSSLLLDPIVHYIGMLPVLQCAAIWRSPNKVFAGSSQLYHMDSEDYRQVKVFILLDDVDENTGPFTLVPKTQTKQIHRQLRRQWIVRRRGEKVADEDIQNAAGCKVGVPFCGSMGAAAFVDTCNVYHFGSRPSEGTAKPRKLLYLHFISPFSNGMPICGRQISGSGTQKKYDAGSLSIRELVLGFSHLSWPNRYESGYK